MFHRFVMIPIITLFIYIIIVALLGCCSTFAFVLVDNPYRTTAAATITIIPPFLVGAPVVFVPSSISIRSEYNNKIRDKNIKSKIVVTTTTTTSRRSSSCNRIMSQLSLTAASTSVVPADDDGIIPLASLNDRTKIRILGVCGGIGSGKSTACQLLVSELNCLAHIGTYMQFINQTKNLYDDFFLFHFFLFVLTPIVGFLILIGSYWKISIIYTK